MGMLREYDPYIQADLRGDRNPNAYVQEHEDAPALPNLDHIELAAKVAVDGRYKYQVSPEHMLALVAEIRALRAQLLETALGASQPRGPADELEWFDMGLSAVEDAFLMLEERGLVEQASPSLWRITKAGREA